mgnify:CR=1
MIHRRRQDGHKNSAADALSSDIREKLISREEPQLAVPGSRLPTLYRSEHYFFSMDVLFIHNITKRTIHTTHAAVHPAPGLKKSIAAPHTKGTAIPIILFP